MKNFHPTFPENDQIELMEDALPGSNGVIRHLFTEHQRRLELAIIYRLIQTYVMSPQPGPYVSERICADITLYAPLVEAIETRPVGGYTPGVDKAEDYAFPYVAQAMLEDTIIILREIHNAPKSFLVMLEDRV